MFYYSVLQFPNMAAHFHSFHYCTKERYRKLSHREMMMGLWDCSSGNYHHLATRWTLPLFPQYWVLVYQFVILIQLIFCHLDQRKTVTQQCILLIILPLWKSVFFEGKEKFVFQKCLLCILPHWIQVFYKSCVVLFIKSNNKNRNLWNFILWSD